MRQFSIWLFIFFVHMNGLIGSDSIEFIGTIQLMDNSLISYRVSFTEDDKGVISGYSISDFGGEHETKSTIKGVLNREKQVISFSETSNIMTKSSSHYEDFCYVHLYNAKIKFKNNKNYIQGHFYSRYIDGSLCVEGDIFLMGQELFFEKTDKTLNKSTKLSESREINQLKNVIEKERSSLRYTVLDETSKMKIDVVEGERLFLKIYDDEYVDGDQISILINGEPLLENFSVTAVPKVVPIDLNMDSTVVRIVSNGVGKFPPNSAKIDVKTPLELIPAKLMLNKGSEAEIVFVKQL